MASGRRRLASCNSEHVVASLVTLALDEGGQPTPIARDACFALPKRSSKWNRAARSVLVRGRVADGRPLDLVFGMSDNDDLQDWAAVKPVATEPARCCGPGAGFFLPRLALLAGGASRGEVPG